MRQFPLAALAMLLIAAGGAASQQNYQTNYGDAYPAPSGDGPREELLVKLFVVDESIVRVRANELWVEHADARKTPVGDEAVVHVQGNAWTPDFGNVAACPCKSAPFGLGFPDGGVPADAIAELEVLSGRGKAYIAEQPRDGNGIIRIHFDDRAFEGGEWYSIRLSPPDHHFDDCAPNYGQQPSDGTYGNYGSYDHSAGPGCGYCGPPPEHPSGSYTSKSHETSSQGYPEAQPLPCAPPPCGFHEYDANRPSGSEPSGTSYDGRNYGGPAAPTCPAACAWPPPGTQQGSYSDRNAPSCAPMMAIHVRALIDGVSEFVWRYDTVWWHHLSGAAPGRVDGKREATIVNGRAWTPVWGLAETEEMRDCECDSKPLALHGFAPPLPRESRIEIVVHQGRGTVTEVVTPTANEGWTRIAFNDVEAGADFYEVEIRAYPPADWRPAPDFGRPNSRTGTTNAGPDGSSTTGDPALDAALKDPALQEKARQAASNLSNGTDPSKIVVPGFEGLFAIGGLGAVGALLGRRRMSRRE